MLLSRKNILSTKELKKQDINQILDTADSFEEISTRAIKKVPTLRGKTIINLFFEPSTRTRTSFEIAGKRLSADVINISGFSSSTVKGESLIDTARNLEAMNPDILVVRHKNSGAPALLSQFVDSPVINAGDGSHEHPSQALLDLLTIRSQKGELEGLRVAIVGPPPLIPSEFNSLGVDVSHNLREVIKNVDVVMVLRIQLERQKQGLLSSLREYSNYFCLTSEILDKARKDILIIHPGPVNRGVEISLDVMESKHSLILDQVTNGVAIRMALFYLLLGEKNANPN